MRAIREREAASATQRERTGLLTRAAYAAAITRGADEMKRSRVMKMRADSEVRRVMFPHAQEICHAMPLIVDGFFMPLCAVSLR